MVDLAWGDGLESKARCVKPAQNVLVGVRFDGIKAATQGGHFVECCGGRIDGIRVDGEAGSVGLGHFDEILSSVGPPVQDAWTLTG